MFFLAVFLAACQMIPTPAPVRIPTAAPNLPATGANPTVIVNNQSSDGTSVVVADVISKGPGWIAIHNQNTNGGIGPAIGHAAVKDGENRNVIVKIDPAQVTGVMYAMLHIDAGQVGVYEFPGPDVPVTVNGVGVTPPFKWTKGAASSQIPTVTVTDQDVSGGVVKVADVFSNGPGWIVIHAQNPDGTPGNGIGFAAVHDGDNQNVNVTIDANKATPTLFAMLHIDAGQVGVYEYPGPDVPEMAGGTMVAPSFRTSQAVAAVTGQPTEQGGGRGGLQTSSPTSATPATASGAQATATAPGMAMDTPVPGKEPVVEVANQAVTNGTVKVSRVVSNGPGWIVIYNQNNNQPGDPIGHTAVKDGENRDVVVKIDTTKATPTLYAQLHIDAGMIGTFEFPGPDIPLMVGVKMIQNSFTTTAQASATAPAVGQASFVKVNDQVIRGGTIMVAEVFSKGPGWLGMHIQNPDGSVGPPIGDSYVQDGDNKNVLVKIDVRKATPVMYAMLHTDAGKIGVWEFPGPDVPVMINGQPLMPAFKITGGLAGKPAVVAAGQSGGTPILVDGTGLTLYTSLKDSPGVSNCDATCRTKWLPYTVTTNGLSIGQGVAVNKIGVILLDDGSHQVTYGGQPLYYYYLDNAPGDAGGQGADGNWFTVTP